MSKFRRSSGFTLIEILVAMFILTIVGIMTSSGLSFIARSRDHFEKKEKMLGKLQNTIVTIENDLLQARSPDRLYPDNISRPALIVRESSLQLNRAGFYIPLMDSSDKSPEVVIYKLAGSSLMRITRIRNQILLDHVKAFHCKLISSKNLSHSVQQGILIIIETAEFGAIKRIIPIAMNITDITSNDVNSNA